MAHAYEPDDIVQNWTNIWVQSLRDYAVIGLSEDGRIRSWNPGGEAIHGFREDEILGKPLDVLYTAEERAQGVPQTALATARREGRFESEGWRLRKDGKVFWASAVLTALTSPEGVLLGFGEIVRDMTDKKTVHDAVLESERRFRLLVDGVTDYAIFMLSPEGRVTNWNSGARRIKGYAASEIIGSHFSRFYTPEDAAKGLPQRGLTAAARDGRFESEGWRVRKDGSKFWAHVVIDAIREGGTLVGFAKITRDINEKMEATRLLEETRVALVQSQKMEAIGKLTGGVAHDFNNVMQILRGNLELLESRHKRDGWTRERLDKAIDAVERGAKLASQLLAFGRQQPLRPVVINLASAIRGMDDLLRRALGETVQIETVVAGGLWNTFVDVHQMENVVLNLAINARDAMNEGGKLTMEVSNAMLDDQYVVGFPDVPPGQYVMLAVTDTGTGMPPEVVQRAFDPFFTTKPEGQGTGLGLSMAYGFVKQSGGHIRIYSEVGHGTTVKIYLPRSTEEAIETPTAPPVTLLGGTETILVVEDDKDVQSTVVDTLSGLGYSVLKANDAEQALAVVRSGVHIDLLFTDVVMPGPLRSPAMVAQAVQLLPRLKVLFTSGYTQNAIVHGGRLDPGVELLSKPYSREQLAYKIRQILGVPPLARSGPVAQTQSAQPAPNVSNAPNTPNTPNVSNAPNATNAPNAPAVDASLRLLLVDDDVETAEAVGELLKLVGHNPTITGSPQEALRLLEAESFDVLVTDLSMPAMPGLELAERATQMRPTLRVIFASGHEMPAVSTLPFRWGALRKPYSIDELDAMLRGFDQ
ncbi:hybrid sensor histidine kinase/response regulator [bacterium M00.F.Ca.ET.228.01.1.1]|uniref:PAS domain S-box protein n=1 Tax=Paraburkholderia phenoliruptrix TaxID=252970 RepID=UPI001091C88B|nr:PAS domain S-box protein [Paraburkholderia phenoliruptrix]TGP45973.1 hybrid sensor histidine kinase/response regulator [bacterium M00.F.Ca.ET.228.01.1.1]TGS04114.1 hybrid sensor histidine kinase/response regulator [bacterium M00.F.Ca.ET.191.01.1.1]TGU07266.1 hybrid sensor histidine kinase/response regulator [bacterium M00.F.Ca.ET.155.01.1.1]MBW0446502.1 PAS domain S-box protein [Paraburkholderia phenoliruptrix]MBW9097071.1 PAS domain S-box protein [Paraburkholderia phenoliruptrix]